MKPTLAAVPGLQGRWQLFLDCRKAGELPFSKVTLPGFRGRLIEHDLIKQAVRG